MEFSKQEHWSGLPFFFSGDLPDPGIKPGSPALQADSLPSELLYLPLWWRRHLSIDWKTEVPYTEIISSFQFCMTNAPRLSAASLLRACTCSSSPDRILSCHIYLTQSLGQMHHLMVHLSFYLLCLFCIY